MRARIATVWVLASFCGTFLHCGGGDDSGAGPVADGGGGTDVGTSSDTGSATDAGDSGTVVTRVDVAGVLYGGFYVSGGLAGRDIVVVGADGVVTQTPTDSAGSFHVAGVAVPYDVAVPGISEDGGQSNSTFYGGISRPDIGVFTAFMPPPEIDYSANVTFTMTLLAGDVIFMGTPTYNEYFNVADGASHAYSFANSWWSAASVSQPVHLIVIHSNGTIASYADFPAQSFMNGVTVALGTITPTAVPSVGSVTATWNVPTGYTFSIQDADLLYADKTLLQPRSLFNEFQIVAATGAFPAPAIPNVSLALFAEAVGPSAEDVRGGAYGIPVTSTPVTYTLPAAPIQTAPTDHAVGVDFAADTLSFTPTSPSGNSEIILTGGEGTWYTATSGTTLALSRLVAAKIGLKSGGTYTWTVTGENQSIDDRVALSSALSLVKPAGTTTLVAGSAAAFTFQTK